VKPTIYDVAKEAKVSIATVSKVINKTGSISDPTRKKVNKVIQRLNYRPNVVASALTKKQTDTLALIIPDISNMFFSEISRYIEDKAHEMGLTLFICSTDYNEEKEKRYIELLQSKQVDGFIIASGFQNIHLVEEFHQNNIPVTLLAQDNLTESFNVVSVDDYRGGFLAINHLISLGHQNIGVIAERVHSSTLRLHAYRDLLGMNGIPIKEENIIRTTASIQNGEKAMLELLQKENRPTAVFAVNDILAVGAMKAARSVGLEVPKDLSVIGFDNMILSTTTVPELTTVAQPIKDMADKIVDVLIRQIKMPHLAKERTLFVPELIVRESTAQPPKYLENLNSVSSTTSD
jgi:DNA-binding LacI/PurR family transcriptional regulator